MNDWHFPRMGRKRHSCADDSSSARSESREQPFVSRASEASRVFESLLTPAAVASAWERVRRNDGAPGVDGLRIADVEPVFALEWNAVENALRSGTWQPLPVRRVSLPKAGGGLRVLGISTVMDRVVHQLVNQLLTSLWEPRFCSRSFAYRQGKGVRQALNALAIQAGSISNPWAWHLDIRQFFDRVPRSQALRAVRRVTDDARLLQLTERILDAGAFERGQVVPTPCGLPQGSPLSPLLANAVLHPLDLWLEQEVPGFVRYADDILIFLPANQAAHPPLAGVQARLDALGLELNSEKTTLTPLEDAACLGFSFWRDDTGNWRRRISPASWAALESEIQRRHSLLWAAFGSDDGAPQEYLTGWLAHYGATEHADDQARIRQLRARIGASRGMGHGEGPRRPAHVATASAARTHIPYDGSSSASAIPPCPHSCGIPAFHEPPQTSFGPHLWRQTLRVWWLRLKAGRLVRVGLDFNRQHRRKLPRLAGLRITLLGFTIRLRL